jgi:hypothetical protein
MSPNNLPIICFLSTGVLSKGIRLSIDPTAASKLLLVVHPCSTQVVFEHVTRCLNVKLLNFSGLAQIIQKLLGNTMWEERMYSRRRRRRRRRRRGDREGDEEVPVNGGWHEIPRSKE